MYDTVKETTGGKGVTDGKGKLKVTFIVKGMRMVSTTTKVQLHYLSELGYLPPLGVADCRSSGVMTS